MTPFIVSLKSDPDQTGIAIDQHLQLIPDAEGKNLINQAIVAVLWDNMRSPAPSYHNPAELSWIDVPELSKTQLEIEALEADDDDDDDDDEPEDGPEDEIPMV